MMVVTPYSDFSREYSVGLHECRTLTRLREFALHWGGLAPDAWEIVSRMHSADEFLRFRNGLERETRREFAGAKWAAQFGAIVMPELLMRVSLVAEQFGVPWGAAFLRCEQEGILQRRGDVYVWVQPEQIMGAQRHE